MANPLFLSDFFFYQQIICMILLGLFHTRQDFIGVSDDFLCRHMGGLFHPFARAADTVQFSLSSRCDAVEINRSPHSTGNGQNNRRTADIPGRYTAALESTDGQAGNDFLIADDAGNVLFQRLGIGTGAMSRIAGFKLRMREYTAIHFCNGHADTDRNDLAGHAYEDIAVMHAFELAQNREQDFIHSDDIHHFCCRCHITDGMRSQQSYTPKCRDPIYR